MHALITGASAGIGAALARALAPLGYDLTLVARRENALQEVADSVGGSVKVNVLPADLTDVSGLDALLEKASELGPIDLLVNNAGMEKVMSSLDMDVATMDRMLALNLQTPVRLTRAVLPGMVERNQGAIVDISSVAAFAHPPYQTLYSATKAALAAFSVSLRSELRDTDVHVLTVYPGPVKTELGLRAARAVDVASDRLPWGTPEGLAKRITSALRRRKGTIVYPRFYWIPRLFPHVTRFAMDLSRVELTEQAATGSNG